MANIKISDLTSASAAADANEFEINESGTSKKVTGSQIKAFVNAGDGALAAKDTVATADIDNLAVTTGKLAADAVDGTKIADDAISNEHIATDAVNADSIAANAVGASEINVTGNGTAGQYLASDGDGTMTWTTLAAGGGFSNIQVFNSSGTWTNPGNIEKVKVTVVGAGGSGGSSSFVGVASWGGGAGGTAIEVISFPSATNVPVTVGAGGAPKTNVFSNNTNGVNGDPGGTSSFGAYCSATGGQGGWGSPRNTNPTSNSAGGSGSGGNINITGERSERQKNGGDSFLGVGGHTLQAPGGGPTNFQPGQYGSGGSYTNTGPNSYTSGAGGTGVVIVEY
jgi:hypothetical protein